MRSKHLQKVYELAEAYVEKLGEKSKQERKLDPRFNCAVQIIHEEGTSMFFRNAFVVKHKSSYIFTTKIAGEEISRDVKSLWYIIIPEHHNIMIYADDEAEVFVFKRSDEEIEEIF